jgi:hypothetical protein
VVASHCLTETQLAIDEYHANSTDRLGTDMKTDTNAPAASSVLYSFEHRACWRRILSPTLVSIPLRSLPLSPAVAIVYKEQGLARS